MTYIELSNGSSYYIGKQHEPIVYGLQQLVISYYIEKQPKPMIYGLDKYTLNWVNA